MTHLLSRTVKRPGAGSTVYIEGADGASADAFRRFRVATPVTLFDSKQVWDNAPLFWDDQETSGSGTGSTHSTDTASTVLDVTAATAGTRKRQTFQSFNYQPGKSQMMLMSFNMIDSGESGITKGLGYYDDDNGIFLLQEDGDTKLVCRSSTTGSAVDNKISQSAWNIDPFDGSGPSRCNLDWSKTQILIIDFEWLGVGRVRAGFVIDGIIVYAHEFLHANNLADVYMSTPNLPLRYELSNDGTAGASTLEAICCTVVSEGGTNDIGFVRAANTGVTPINANTQGTLYACLGIRLKSGYKGVATKLLHVSMIAGSADDLFWELHLNPTVGGTFTYSDVTNSAVQIATGNKDNPSTNTVTLGTLVESGVFRAEGGMEHSLDSARQLGFAIDGTADEFVLSVRPITANADVYATLHWRELL